MKSEASQELDEEESKLPRSSKTDITQQMRRVDLVQAMQALNAKTKPAIEDGSHSPTAIAPSSSPPKPASPSLPNRTSMVVPRRVPWYLRPWRWLLRLFGRSET